MLTEPDHFAALWWDAANKYARTSAMLLAAMQRALEARNPAEADRLLTAAMQISLRFVAAINRYQHAQQRAEAIRAVEALLDRHSPRGKDGAR